MGQLASKYGPSDAPSTPSAAWRSLGRFELGFGLSALASEFRGFYGPPDSFEGSGESLIVGDPDEALFVAERGAESSQSTPFFLGVAQEVSQPGLGLPDPLRSHRDQRHLGGEALARRPDDGGCLGLRLISSGRSRRAILGVAS